MLVAAIVLFVHRAVTERWGLRSMSRDPFVIPGEHEPEGSCEVKGIQVVPPPQLYEK